MSMNRRTVIKGALAAGVASQTLRVRAAVAQAGPIKVGFLTVKTGPLASGGIQMEQGLTAFFKERDNKLAGVVKRAHEGKSFWQDPEAGPWASVITSAPKFAEAFAQQDMERYLSLVSLSGRTLFDRDTAVGAEAEEIMAMKMPVLIVPGDDPAHATSAAHYVRELLPKPEFWPVMPPEQAPERVRDRILEFRRAHG